MQRVFLRWLKRPRTTDPARLNTTYLRRAGRNEAVSVLRERERELRRVRDLADVQRTLLIDPDLNGDREEGRAAVREAIEHLRPRCRDVARLTWMEGHSRTEITGILGIGVGRVERHRKRAREEVGRLLRFRGATGGPWRIIRQYEGGRPDSLHENASTTYVGRRVPKPSSPSAACESPRPRGSPIAT